MARFGNETQEAQFVDISSAFGFMGLKATLAEAGTITSVTAYFGKDSGVGDYIFAIYKVSDNSLVGYSDPVAIPASYGWHSADLITPYAADAGDYRLEIWTTGTAAYGYYHTGVGVFPTDTTPGTWPTPQATWNGSDGSTGEMSIYATYAVGGDISVPITGVSGTASVGTLVLGLAMLLATVVGTGSVGTASPESAVSASGVSTGMTYPLNGVEATGEVGTVTPEFGVGSDITIPLTGVSANPAYQLSGVSAMGSVGTLSPNIEAVDIILPLTGVLGTGAVGEVLYLPLGGWAATGEVGSVAPAVAPPITGNEATAAVGSVGQDRTAGLIGAAANGIAGGWNNIARALTGAEGTEGTGTLAPRSSGAITGNAATIARGSLVQSHDVAIAGVTGTGRAGYLDTFAPGSVSRPLTGVYATGRIGTMTCIDPSPNYVHVKSRKRILTVQPRHRIITVTRRRF